MSNRSYILQISKTVILIVLYYFSLWSVRVSPGRFPLSPGLHSPHHLRIKVGLHQQSAFHDNKLSNRRIQTRFCRIFLKKMFNDLNIFQLTLTFSTILKLSTVRCVLFIDPATMKIRLTLEYSNSLIFSRSMEFCVFRRRIIPE